MIYNSQNYTISNSFRFNVLYLAFMIIWPVFRTLYMNGFDNAGRIPFFLMTVAVIVNRKAFLNCPKLVLLWFLWVAYNIFNSLTKGFYNETVSFYMWLPTHLIRPFVTMVVAFYTTNQNFNKTAKYMFYSFLLYFIMGIFKMNFAENYQGYTKLQNELGNSFINISILLPVFAFLSHHQNIITRKILYILLVLESILILYSGERKALVCLLVIILGGLFSENLNKNKMISIFALIPIVYFGLDYIMAYTIAGARFQEGFENSSYSDNFFLSLMGDRAFMYYDGWQMFLNNIWTGIGLGNFRWHNTVFEGLPLHTEYMVQLTECGIFGSTLFILFHYGLIKRCVVSYRIGSNNPIWFVIVSSYVALLLIFFVAWAYDNTCYFLFFGYMLAYLELLLKEKEYEY